MKQLRKSEKESEKYMQIHISEKKGELKEIQTEYETTSS